MRNSFTKAAGTLQTCQPVTTSLRRILWPCLMAVTACVHFLCLDAHPLLRMVAICSVLLVGMKVIVLAEWGGKLALGRRLAFCFLWFGMEPVPFAAPARRLSWKKDTLLGLCCFTAGMVASVCVAQMQSPPLLLMFVPLSLAFHYGVLRLHTAFWRWRGIAIRPLFRNPLGCAGLADFWSKRWNLPFSQMMARAVQRPVAARLGRRAGILSVFLASGLLHELAITLPVRAGYGSPTLYFAAHGLLVLLERDNWPLWVKRMLALLLVTGPLPLLFPAEFTREVIVFTLNHLNPF